MQYVGQLVHTLIFEAYWAVGQVVRPTQAPFTKAWVLTLHAQAPVVGRFIVKPTPHAVQSPVPSEQVVQF